MILYIHKLLEKYINRAEAQQHFIAIKVQLKDSIKHTNDLAALWCLRGWFQKELEQERKQNHISA